MLARENRLPVAEFSAVRGRTVRVVNSEFFTIRVKVTDSSVSRAGFIVSGKVAGNAVHRNHVRRLLSESLQEAFKGASVSQDVLVIGKPGCGDLSLAVVRSAVLKAVTG